MLADFFCKKCGNSEDDVLLKDSEEVHTCLMCNEPMERKFSGTIYKPKGRPGTPYPTHLLGRGANRAGFGRLE